MVSSSFSIKKTILKRNDMRQFVTLFIIIIGIQATAHAQTFLDHLKQKTSGQGTVTVLQSKEIDELVNGKNMIPIGTKAKTTNQKTVNTTHNKAVVENETQHKGTESQHKLTTSPDSVKKQEIEKQEKEEETTPIVDMRKKVMRSSYKVTGYRVQAYAGGNSRNDRLKAEQIGNDIKLKCPDQPVYVHFYSPRWICRVGNFRSLSEANKMLSKIRAMGYKQACLVKGQITVQN